MTETELADIDARSAEATPEPWWVRDGDLVVDNAGAPLFRSIEDDGAGRAIEMADARFVAHARSDLPALLADVRRLRAALAHIRERAGHGDVIERGELGDIADDALRGLAVA